MTLVAIALQQHASYLFGAAALRPGHNHVTGSSLRSQLLILRTAPLERTQSRAEQDRQGTVARCYSG
jgi:hypothetical protein